MLPDEGIFKQEILIATIGNCYLWQIYMYCYQNEITIAVSGRDRTAIERYGLLSSVYTVYNHVYRQVQKHGYILT